MKRDTGWVMSWAISWVKDWVMPEQVPEQAEGLRNSVDYKRKSPYNAKRTGTITWNK